MEFWIHLVINQEKKFLQPIAQRNCGNRIEWSCYIRFRSNTKSEAGKAEFLSLSPDEYFIKPQLKEYEFNPKHKMQKLQQGENAHITWTAKRVAFSIHGKIVSLNGQAEPGTTLKGKLLFFFL